MEPLADVRGGFSLFAAFHQINIHRAPEGNRRDDIQDKENDILYRSLLRPEPVQPGCEQDERKSGPAQDQDQPVPPVHFLTKDAQLQHQVLPEDLFQALLAVSLQIAEGNADIQLIPVGNIIKSVDQPCQEILA